MNESLIRKPSAYLPLIMSSVGLAMIVIHVARFGIVESEDDGTPARLFQLLMVAQLPIILYFAARWLAVAPRKALAILALLVAVAVVPILLILYLEA